MKGEEIIPNTLFKINYLHKRDVYTVPKTQIYTHPTKKKCSKFEDKSWANINSNTRIISHIKNTVLPMNAAGKKYPNTTAINSLLYSSQKLIYKAWPNFNLNLLFTSKTMNIRAVNTCMINRNFMNNTVLHIMVSHISGIIVQKLLSLSLSCI